jgi:hypothetical protein
VRPENLKELLAPKRESEVHQQGTIIPSRRIRRKMLLLQVPRAYSRKKESVWMVVVKKSAGGGGPQTLDILACRVKIIQAELILEEREIRLDNGTTFMADPNLNCKFLVEKNLVEAGVHEGATIYDRFRLKADDDGDWVVAKYSKLGNLVQVRYGEQWFDDPAAEFDERDFEDFSFICRIQPKRNAKGEELKGSSIDWQSMRQASPREEKVIANKAAEAEAEEAEDFSDIPF